MVPLSAEPRVPLVEKMSAPGYDQSCLWVGDGKAAPENEARGYPHDPLTDENRHVVSGILSAVG